MPDYKTIIKRLNEYKESCSEDKQIEAEEAFVSVDEIIEAVEWLQKLINRNIAYNMTDIIVAVEVQTLLSD